MAETKEPQQPKHRFNQEDDAACIAEWRRMLDVFKSLTKDDTKKAIALKEEAKKSHLLTYRQVDGICARVDGLLNGTYGNTKRPEHLAHGKA